MLRLNAAMLLLLGLIWSEGRGVTAPQAAPALSAAEDGAADPARPDAVVGLPPTPHQALAPYAAKIAAPAHEDVPRRVGQDVGYVSSPRGPPSHV